MLTSKKWLGIKQQPAKRPAGNQRNAFGVPRAKSVKAMFLLGLILALGSCISSPNKQLTQGYKSLATVSPITHSMATALLQKTDIKVAYLPPKRLPVNRIPSWLYKNNTRKHPPFDAHLTIASARPALQYGLSLRQSNIRLVTIDIANALLPKGERVVMAKPDEYFWLSINNALLMAGVLKRDLSLMWPEQSANINQNYQQLSQTLRRIQQDSDRLLIDHDIAALYSANKDLRPFLNSYSSDFLEPAEAKLFGVKLITVNAQQKRSRAIDKQQAQENWLIDDFSRYDDRPFIERWQQNHQALKSVLANTKAP